MTKRGWKYMERGTEFAFKQHAQSLLTGEESMFWWSVKNAIHDWFWTLWYYNPIYTFFYKLKHKDEE